MSHDDDASYKTLFAAPEVVRDLILGFVPDEWLRDGERLAGRPTRTQADVRAVDSGDGVAAQPESPGVAEGA